ncbi:hypothetical protein [Cuspidothrix issatschenkoi]|uniref:Uncharacterized protein n=1 Tax=Cuspidothrix issatschenkoi CHARLIE-1 TaxID=2052836 RepID=A0A2S6CRQ3_9CYAN|nr:hypothetical protein [Cuspidothrix issatschenkoi]PPJ62455.1 hypothetical protein CUN59_15555 [Cuspidothrix issatschenkoi CHARLIE-1]
MSKNFNQDLQKNAPGVFIAGLFFLAIGIIGFISRGEPFTIGDLIYCIISVGISFLLLPFLVIILLSTFSFFSPIIGFIGAIIAIILLYGQPAFATGLGILITSIGALIITRNNANSSGGNYTDDTDDTDRLS